MKEKELRTAATCAMCRRKIGETGLPVFYRVTVARYGIDLKAVERQQGLTMLLGGNAMIASAMGPDEDMTVTLMEPATITVCDPCAGQDVMVHLLAELTGGSRKQPLSEAG